MLRDIISIICFKTCEVNHEVGFTSCMLRFCNQISMSWLPLKNNTRFVVRLSLWVKITF